MSVTLARAVAILCLCKKSAKKITEYHGTAPWVTCVMTQVHFSTGSLNAIFFVRDVGLFCLYISLFPFQTAMKVALLQLLPLALDTRMIFRTLLTLSPKPTGFFEVTVSQSSFIASRFCQQVCSVPCTLIFLTLYAIWNSLWPLHVVLLEKIMTSAQGSCKSTPSRCSRLTPDRKSEPQERKTSAVPHSWSVNRRKGEGRQFTTTEDEEWN